MIGEVHLLGTAMREGVAENFPIKQLRASAGLPLCRSRFSTALLPCSRPRIPLEAFSIEVADLGLWRPPLLLYHFALSPWR